MEGEKRRKGRGREGEGEGKGFAGPMSNYFLLACERLQRKTYYLFVYVPVGTVIFDRNNHEAN